LAEAAEKLKEPKRSPFYDMNFGLWLLCIVSWGIPILTIGGLIWLGMAAGLFGLCVAIANWKRVPLMARFVSLALINLGGYTIFIYLALYLVGAEDLWFWPSSLSPQAPAAAADGARAASAAPVAEPTPAPAQPAPEQPVRVATRSSAQPNRAPRPESQRSPPPLGQAPPTERSAGPRIPPAASDFKGLVAYWSFDEIMDGVAADGSGQERPGNVVRARQAEGIRGQALLFNGRDSYLDYGASPAFNIQAGAAFTYAGWIKTRARSGAVLSQRDQRNGGAVFDILLNAGRLRAQLRQDGNEIMLPLELPGKSLINDGAWHHFALTRHGATVALHVDAQAQATAVDPVGGFAITTDLRTLGCEGYWLQRRQASFGGVATFLDGALDEICIFDRALSADEIRRLAGR
jgi:Concanavalin A-like lectin/glucanases superfamily